MSGTKENLQSLDSISNDKINFFRKNIIIWGKKNYSGFPWRKTKNRWHALVAEIMLQRTKAEQVLPVYEVFSSKYKKPSDYSNDRNAALFKSLGLNWREKELKKLARVLSENEIPDDKKNLLKLPGVGEYIASAYRSLHQNKREVIIDSNIVRLYGRFFGFTVDGETRRKSWLKELADGITPSDNFKDFNYGLIDFTRKICKPKPLCESCLLKKNCNYHFN